MLPAGQAPDPAQQKLDTREAFIFSVRRIPVPDTLYALKWRPPMVWLAFPLLVCRVHATCDMAMKETRRLFFPSGACWMEVTGLGLMRLVLTGG